MRARRIGVLYLKGRNVASGLLFDLPCLEKRCTKCKCIKLLEEFHKARRGKHGRSQRCKKCQADRHREYFYSMDKEQRRKHCRDKQVKCLYTPQGIMHSLYFAAKNRAKKLNIPFNLTPQFVKDRILHGICEATGWKLDILAAPRSFYRPSLDQIIPRDGYTPANVRMVCWGVNKLLSNIGDDKLLEVADAIRSRRESVGL